MASPATKLTKRSVGRPPVFSEEKTKIIIDALLNDLPMEIAADYAMVTDQTIRNWMKDKPDFLAQVRYARAKASGNLINTVKQDSSGAWKILKNKLPQHFKDEPQVVINQATMIRIENADGTNYADLSLSHASAPTEADALQSPDTSGYLGDTGGQIHTGAIVAAKPDKPE